MHLAGAENLIDTYRALNQQEDLFGVRRGRINLPVNLNVYRVGMSPIVNYKYRDEYTFDDRVLIYDQRTGFNRGGKNLFGGIIRSNSQTYRGKYLHYNTGYARKRDEHVDWTDNGYGLRLSEILRMEPSHREPFTPAEKYIYLSYNHLHTKILNLYSFYLNPKYGIENIHGKIAYGRLKDRAMGVSDLQPGVGEIDSEFCLAKDRVLNDVQIGLLKDVEEGYEGMCDRQNFADLYHPDLNWTTERKWSTPYVAYDFRVSSAGLREYYHYLLGDYADNYGRSENLFGEEDNRRIWSVNYDNIFGVGGTPSGLLFTLNKFKLPRNIRDFLKISTLFRFEFSYEELGEAKSATFDMEQILSGRAEVNGNLSGSLFSNFSVSLRPKEEKGGMEVRLMDGLEKCRYRVDVEGLRGGDLLLDRIVVEPSGIEKYIPSQFLKDGMFADHFHFSSERGRRIKFGEKNVEKLKIWREFNDEDGTLRVRYYDPLTREMKEVNWRGMRRIPLENKITATAESEEGAKNILRKIYNLPDYFWDSIKFVPVLKDDVFKQYRRHKIAYKFYDPRIERQWGSIVSEIFIFNEMNISPISFEITGEMARGNMADLFRIRRSRETSDFPIEDYVFRRVGEENGNVTVEVSLDRGDIAAKREYVFRVVENGRSDLRPPKISTAAAKDPAPYISNELQKAIAGIGCVLLGGGGVFAISKFIPAMRWRL